MTANKRELRLGAKRLHPDLSIRILEGQVPNGQVSLYNISKGGMFLEGQAAAVKAGEGLKLALQLGAEQPIVAQTDVRWIRNVAKGPFEPQGLGLQITHLDPRDRGLLETFLNEGALNVTVADIMATGEFVVPYDMSLGEVLSLRKSRYLPAAMVLGADGKLAGVVPIDWLAMTAAAATQKDLPISHFMMTPSFVSPDMSGSDLIRSVVGGADLTFVVGTSDKEFHGLLTRDLLEGVWPILLRSFLREGIQPMEESVFRLVHDLRTPLAAIQSTHSLLTEKGIDLRTYRKHGFANAVESNCHRLMDLTEDILSLAGGAHAKKTANLRAPETPLAPIVQDLTDRLGALAAKRSIQLRMKVPHNLLWPIPSTLVIRMLENLIGNSLRNSGAGTEVIISAVADGSFLKITISDAGVGVTPAVLHRVRETLCNRTSFPTQSVDGTTHGFGLSIVRQLADAIQSKIDVTTNSKGGLDIVVSLPRLGQAVGGAA